MIDLAGISCPYLDWDAKGLEGPEEHKGTL